MHSVRAYHFLFVLTLLGFAAFAVADIVSGTSSVGSSSNVTITQLPIEKPAAASAGDLLLASIALHDGSATSITPPAGWTLVLRTDKETNVGIATYYRIANASEPATYTWTLSPETRAQGGITSYSGVDTANPIDAVAGAADRGQTATAPTITTGADNEMVVATFALHVGSSNHSGNWFSTPAGMSEKYDSSKTAAGPTIALFDAIQTTAGVANSKSSDIAGNLNRDWVAQTIALRPISAVTADDFDSYADGDLNGLSSGTGWTGAWTGSTDFDIQGTVTFEGAKAIAVNVPGGQEPSISRTFAPKTSGVLHWAQRKDAPDHGSNLRLQSGSTIAATVGIGSVTQPQPGGPDWYAGGTFLQDYTTGQFDTVDVEFDTSTDQFRVSIDGGTYSSWINFANTVTSVDTIQIEIGASGNDVGPNYWDDIRFNN